MSFNVGNILKAIGNEISKILDGAEYELKTVILPAVTAVGNALKAVIDADTSDLIGLLAGKAGQAMEDKVRTALDSLIPKLQLAQQFLNSGATSATILANIAKLISTAPAATQAAFYIEFTGLLASDLAGGLTVGEAVTIEQWWYANDPAWLASQQGTATPPATPPTTPPATPTTPAT
jgi:hypothetical protein